MADDTDRRALYDRLLKAYEATPESHADAARAVGVTRTVARDYWRRGVATLGLPPIQDLPEFQSPDRRMQLAAEEARQAAATARADAEEARRLLQTAKAAAGQPEADIARKIAESTAAVAAVEAAADVAARAAAKEARAAVEARAEARDDAVGVLDEERRLRKGLRAVAGQNIVGSAKWGRAHALVADELVSRVERQRKDMTVDQLADLARAMAAVDRQRAALLREAVELERLHRGDPSVILGVTPTEMSPDEAIREIEEANADLQRYRRRGLELIEGGATTGPVIDVSPV